MSWIASLSGVHRLVVACAGVIGATVKWAVVHPFGAETPAGAGAVFGVNLAGSLAMGAAVAMADRYRWPARLRDALTVGFCGGLTTFSSVSVELAQRFESGEVTFALAYATASIGSCVAAVLLGSAAARRVGAGHGQVAGP